jgi:metal-dependent amidase/aminoacylase/carboxypeptidase family protein
VSHKIHESGRCFQERRIWIAETLAETGFEVKTAFAICRQPSRQGWKRALHVAICAEYDALPGIGHACGHNIIAAAAVGAGIAATSVAEEVGLTVSVIGTPGEEKGDAGGKILLLERGAFAGVHAAMMVHPAPLDVLTPRIIAASMFEVRYTGKEAHASAFPEMGINAADALTIAQTAIGLLRQHILPTDRIHGILSMGMRERIPRTRPPGTLCGQTLAELERLRPRVYRCFGPVRLPQDPNRNPGG